MNDLVLSLNTNSKIREEIILYEENFLSRLYRNKSESLIITNLNDSSCDEQENTVIKEENNFSSNLLENLTRFKSVKDLEENSNRKTFGSSKKVSFNLDSIETIGKDKIKTDHITTRPNISRIPQLKKLESKSKSMKVFSTSIQDKLKTKAFTTSEKSFSSKYSTYDIKNKNLIFQKHQKYLERISCEGFGGQFSNTRVSPPIRSFSSKGPQRSQPKYNSKINLKTFSTKTANMRITLASPTNDPNQSNSFVKHIKNKLKQLLDNEYDSRLEKFCSGLMKLDENKDILFKEKSHEIIKFIQTIHEEKFKIVLEIHKKFEDDLNKLENMLDPRDVHNISNKIYRFVYEDKQEELRRIEREFSEKKLKGLEDIEKYYEKVSKKFSEKKIKKFQEFKKEFSEDLTIKIANFWGKKDNINNDILHRTTHSLGNFSSNNNLSFENKKTLSKRLFQ